MKNVNVLSIYRLNNYGPDSLTLMQLGEVEELGYWGQPFVEETPIGQVITSFMTRREEEIKNLAWAKRTQNGHSM